MNVCDECKKETSFELYPCGFWYYDNNGNHKDIGKELKICQSCLEKKGEINE